MDSPIRFDDHILQTPALNNFHEPDQDLKKLLPATRRLEQDGHRIIPARWSTEFLEKDLLVTRLDDIASWLWVCGRPMPPRPLHYQLLLSREISVTEDPGLHMVWHKKRIFIKPMPRYLLDPKTSGRIFASRNTETQYLRACAKGFLHSYCALVSYESDFRIALHRGLLPPEFTWKEWQQLTTQLLQTDLSVNPRYIYGELRLGRLNKVYKVRKGRLLRGYAQCCGPRDYREFVGDHFALVASVLSYLVLALTAMQVGLQSEILSASDAFQSASYGFTVFAIAAPLVFAAGIFLIVMVMFCDNFWATKKFEKAQFERRGMEPPWKEKDPLRGRQNGSTLE